MANNGAALHVKYRPKRFADVLGNDEEIGAFADAITKQEQQTYLLIGPSGVGKTTLARIAATKLGCTQTGLSEINAAKYNGVDDMRAVEDLTMYRPFGSPVRCIIVDECHMLSAPAWNSLLKVTEEPPEDCYWFFCTTNIAKVPDTMQTRAMRINLGPLKEKEVQAVLERIVTKAGLKPADGLLTMIADNDVANGSARLAIQYLQKVDGVTDLNIAAKNLQKAIDSDPVIGLCRILASRKAIHWREVQPLLDRIEKDRLGAEGVRIIAMHYFAKALRNTKENKQAAHFLNLLSYFKEPYNQAEQYAPLYLSVGRRVM